MPKDKLNTGKIIGSEKGLLSEQIERSAAEVAETAERIKKDIDKIAVDFQAQESRENPSVVQELTDAAQSTQAQANEILYNDSEEIQVTVENTNTPEYKKAQDYAKQVQVKIASILQSISDDRLRGKTQFKLDKISKSFWFFCKEMAFNDMEEFDYNSKISMMESNYQKVLVEIDAISADLLVKDKKKVPNREVSKVTPVENPVEATSDDRGIETAKQDESKVSAEADSQSAMVEPKNIDLVVEDNIQVTDQGSDRFQELENLHRTMTQESAKTKLSLGKLKRKKRTTESTINSDASPEMPLAVDNDFSYNQAQSWEALYLALSNKLGSAAEPIMDRLRLVELGDRSTPEELSKTEGMTPEIIAAVDGLRHKSFEESHEDFQYFENLYNYIERIVLPDRAKKIIKNIEAFRAGKISEEVLVAGLQPLYSGWVVPEIKSLLAKEAEGSTPFVIESSETLETTADKPLESPESAPVNVETVPATMTESPELVPTPEPSPEPEPVTPETEPEPVNPEPVPTPEPVIPDKVEKDLGYLDIDPKAIWEKLTPQDMVALQTLMKSGDQAKINTFYQTKIKEVLIDQKKEESVNEELEKQMAEAVNAIIQNQIQHYADTEILKTSVKDKGAVVAKIVKNISIMGGAAIAIGLLGVGTGGAGIAVTAVSMTLVRFALRKIDARVAEKTPTIVIEKAKQEKEENLSKKKAEILATIFAPENAEKLREELSGHISNVLRVQTSERALKALREYEQADRVKEPEVAGAKLREVEKQLYLNALTRMRAEHPEATPEQQQNMALTLALTLGSHEKGENLAKQRLEAIKKSKPALYKLIEKFNLLNAGSPDKKPAGMSQEDESTWDKYKYDLVSLGIGSAVGIGIRSLEPVRIAMGVVAGASIGYKVGEWMEKRDEKKALAEIVKMIDEGETKIRDIEFPTEEIDQLKKDSVFVKSKLDLGLLDGDPLLKSRAENFIHQVQKIELANQESFKKLLDSVTSRTDKRTEQVDADLDRIGSKLKNRRLWSTIGGAVIGGVATWGLGELMHKKEVEDKPTSGSSNVDGAKDDSSGSNLGVEQPRPPQVTGNPYFEDKIDSTNMSGSDSIWRSTHQIFEDHAKELGYKGDLNDQQALSAWAENQTANVVNHLNQEQGGNIKDLVHDGDAVRLSFENGKPHLSFTASSGLEAGHLPDSNVGHLVENQHFNANVDHHIVLDKNTGDQYLEIKSGSDIYRVYDWDRDAQPNVIFPDGHTQEMSVGELNKLLAEKNILAVENAKIESTVDTVTAPEVVTANITEQKVEDFINNGSAYTRDVYESAKNSGHMSDLVSSVVKGENPVQTGALISDYARDSGWSEDKIKIFLNAVRSGEKIDLSSGQFDTNDPDIILKNMEAFERSALDNFDKVKDMPAEHWIPARIGDQYFNIQKIHSGFWPARSDHWLIDTNGDFATDAIKLDDHAMRAAFSQDKIELTREALEKLSGKK